MSKIKAILWDIDGTLLNFEEAEKYAIRKCFSIFGLGECTDEMLQTYSTINKGYWKRLEKGEISKIEVLEGRFRDFFVKYSLDVSVASQFNAEYQLRLGDTTCFYNNALEVVRKLKGKVPQYAVTNGTKVAQDRKLKNSGLDKLLDKVYISEEVGVEKPGIGFFDKVFEEIGEYVKSEVLIIGDSLTSDIQGGNNAGILTCWFNPDKKENTTDLRIDYEISDLIQVLEILKYKERDMKSRYIFREIKKEEIPQMFYLIIQRMKWMDEKGIQQWNVTKYDEVYPELYYESKRKKGEVFVLENKSTNEIVCAAVLKEQDSRWNDSESAIFVHNFASKIGEKGVGRIFLQYAEEYAMKKGKKYFRLDSAVDNKKLEEYYLSQGFISVGECEDGLYKGILRQKELKYD